ncbi:CidA/LrgA family protein [Methanosarcina sp. MSH10X1]|uniref:CidA/LrgA family protein n=1 Tax=Methanosarcina sp. MSH10X1 TaxID=2507075 RepID=UPI000FFB492D|nr:CidA/LrgA family protein [Methanosarcina sp. MSH10X1]RXA16928.1 CidA/LrgA family protein [Methanosarcina sp. MSH10X1]
MLKQFSIILGIFFLGELIQKVTGLLVPGNVIGMLILFFGLYSGVIKLNMIGKISDFFLENLAFFFLPAGVSLITCFALLEGKWTAILVISLISTAVTLAVTGLTVEFVQRSLGKKPANTACCTEKEGDEGDKGIEGNDSRFGTKSKRVNACEKGAEEVS